MTLGNITVRAILFCAVFLQFSVGAEGLPTRQELYTLQTSVGPQYITVYVNQEANQLLSMDGKKPALLLLHGGFSGDGGGIGTWAETWAKRGFVVAVPSYRGEVRHADGKKSAGRIEFCSGEVDDAQATFSFLLSRSDVNPNAIVALGVSHGGCIALRLGIREPRLRAVVASSAPSVAAEAVRHMRAHPLAGFLLNAILSKSLQSYIGGSPEDVPQRYVERSPLYTASRFSMPVMLVHGGNDHVVPTVQTCWMAQALQQAGRYVQERWLQSNGVEDSTHPLFCPLQRSASLGARVNAPRTELWFVEGQDHVYISRSAEDAVSKKAWQFFLSAFQENRRS